MDISAGPLSGRPHGGLGVLWRKSLGNVISVQSMDDDRLLSISIKIGSGASLELLNVYLPYDDGSNLEKYQSYMTKLEDKLSESVFSCAMGDFNANILQQNNRFGQELKMFCQEENLVISDEELCTHDSFTYFSSAHNTVAWLDHIISTHNLHSLIHSIWMNYNTLSSDHFPIFMKVDVGRLPINDDGQLPSSDSSNTQRVKWSNMSDYDITGYSSRSKYHLSQVQLDHPLLLCDDATCTDDTHRDAIDNMFDGINNALKDASAHISTNSSHKVKKIPNWRETCADLHDQARDAFILWKINGKPRAGPICQIMRSTRANFKAALRLCKKNNQRDEADQLAKKLLNSNRKDFWKNIKNVKNEHQNVPLAENIDGATGAEAITKMWKEHYSKLLNSSADERLKGSVIGRINEDLMYERVSSNQIAKAIDTLKKGKSAGIDGIYGEHLKYADNQLHGLLMLLFNAMVIHGHLPANFMKTLIVPMVKDKKSNIQSSDNYRPIALTSIVSKVFEIVILEEYGSLLTTSPHQFGFKPKHGTEQGVFVLQQVIEFYKMHSSPVYACFLDLSKAFDRINHWVLFDKLLKRRVPVIIVRILQKWYSMQRFIVGWGKSMSEPFGVSNGVRQGGILSPFLFNVVVDDLSLLLNSLNVGCYINGASFNHLIYADDTVILAPSPSALQKLISKCEEFANDTELVFNPKKTKLMCFKPNMLADINVPMLCINGVEIEQVIQHTYLGVILTDDCMNDKAIEKEKRQLYCRGNKIIRLFKHCTNNVKIQLFTSFCTSLYCASLWANFKMNTLKKIKVAHNSIFRILLNEDRFTSASGLFVKHNVPNMDVLVRKLTFSLYTRVLHSDNPLINGITNSMYFQSSMIYNQWKNQLYTK